MPIRVEAEFQHADQARDAVIDLERRGLTDAERVELVGFADPRDESTRRIADRQVAQSAGRRAAVGGAIGMVVGALIGAGMTLLLGIEPQPTAALGGGGGRCAVRRRPRRLLRARGPAAGHGRGQRGRRPGARTSGEGHPASRRPAGRREGPLEPRKRRRFAPRTSLIPEYQGPGAKADRGSCSWPDASHVDSCAGPSSTTVRSQSGDQGHELKGRQSTNIGWEPRARGNGYAGPVAASGSSARRRSASRSASWRPYSSANLVCMHTGSRPPGYGRWYANPEEEASTFRHCRGAAARRPVGAVQKNGTKRASKLFDTKSPAVARARARELVGGHGRHRVGEDDELMPALHSTYRTPVRQGTQAGQYRCMRAVRPGRGRPSKGPAHDSDIHLPQQRGTPRRTPLDRGGRCRVTQLPRGP